MKILYFDCSSGICGDMVLAAFIDLGVNIDDINTHITKLGLDEKPSIKAEIKTPNFITGMNTNVKCTKNTKSKLRGFREILSIIEEAELAPFVKEKSLHMFRLIGEAESKIHNVPLEKVHFHEIGAIDSIVDIVGVAVCFHILNPSRVFFSPIPIGSGTIKSEHGELPLPAPASVEILKGVPVYGVDTQGELVTPTGAAIIKTFADGFSIFPCMSLDKTGTGLGKKKLKSLPGVLRILSGSPKTTFESDTVYIIEANIDNLNPEFWSHIQDTLLKKGALDVTLTPIIMKKGRPGQTLSVICYSADLDKLIDSILTETPTIGLRYYEAARRKLKRESTSLQTSHGPLKAKKVILPSGEKFYPEYEDLKKIACEKNIPIHQLYFDILQEINKSK